METRANGEPRSYRITKIPMQAVDGEPHSHVITIGEDVTDIAARQDRLAQGDQFAALGQLASGIVHEARGPLDEIEASASTLRQVMADLAQSGATVPDHADEAARVVAAQAARCKAMLGIISEFSGSEAHGTGASEVGALFEHARALVSTLPAFGGLAVRVIVDANLPPVAGHPDHLAQVLLALLRNAADAMDGQGTITLRGRSGEGGATGAILEVIDEGRGIARADLPRIFEWFYTTKGPGRGTGLGLSICHSIVTRHGGRIEVDSAVGAGSTFRIHLPGAPSHD